MRRAAVAAVIGLLLAACDLLTGAMPPPAPQPCNQVFNAVRCLAMIDYAAFQLKTTREDIVSVAVLPEPTVVIDGKVILQTRSGGPPIDVGVVLADGSSHVVGMHCGGVAMSPQCVDDPQLRAGSMLMSGGGYHDVPEGSSPVPSPAPDALAEATELRINHIEIPIDHVGPYEVTLGEALLPNGLLTAAEFALVDSWPEDVTIIDGGVDLQVRSQVDGKVLWNIYDHGWREGTELVDVFLVFDVFRFEPGATLAIRNVVVR